uniref:Zinc finger protein Rlf/292/654 TPR repeats domain-containing protein n=1 Tax=Strigamia maritima TaxID=126957 RepID=T1IVH3_STRMM
MADRRSVFMGEEDKVRSESALDTLIESWDALGCGNQENVHEKIVNLFKLTVNSILQVNWLNIKPELKCRLNYALQNCLCQAKSYPASLSLINALIEVSNTDSWYNQALATILNDQTSDSNVIGSLKHYCGTMNSDILWLQLQSLVQDEREDLALKFCTCCLNYSTLKTEERVHDLYYKLLFQLGLIDRLTKELLSSYSCEKGIDFVNRVLTSSNNDALSFASCLIQIFLVRDIFSQTTYSYTKNLMEMWINVLHKLNVTSQMLWEQVMTLASIFTTSAHYYLVVDLLFVRFGSKLLRLYVELYIKGLTVDLNYLENARMERTSDVNELEIHFANVLCKLAQILGSDHSLLARECFLSAFSINPTKDRLDKLKEFAVVVEDKKKSTSEQKYELCSGFCHCVVQGACRQSPKKTCEKTDDTVANGATESRATEDTITDEVKSVLSSVLDRIVDSEVDPWNISHYIFEEKSEDLPEQILEDLTIVLDEPRNKTLSWELNWTELKNRCEIYLETKSARKVTMMSSSANTNKPLPVPEVIKQNIVLPICNAVPTTVTPRVTTVLKIKEEQPDEPIPIIEPSKVAVSEANPTFYLDRPTNETSFLKEALTRTNLIKLVRVTDLKAKGEPVLLEELRRREFHKSQSLVSFKSVPFFNAIPTSSTKLSTTKEQVAAKTVATRHSKQIPIPPPARSIESTPKITAKSPNVLGKTTHSIVPGIQVQCDNSKLELPVATNEATKITPQKTNTFIHVSSAASTDNCVGVPKIPLLAHTALVKAGLTMEQMNPKVVISHSDMVDANKLLINNEKVLVSGTHGNNNVSLAIGSKDKTKSPNGINSEVPKDDKGPKKSTKKLVINSSDVGGASIQLPVMQIVAPMQLQPGITSGITTENKINFVTLTQSTPNNTVSTPVQVYTSPMVTSSTVSQQNMLGGSLPSTTRLHVKLVDNAVSFAKNTVTVARPTPTTGSYVLFNARCTVVNPNASSSATNTETIQIVSQPNVVAAVQSSLQSVAEFPQTINNGVPTTTVQQPCIGLANTLAKTGTTNRNEEPSSNSAEDTMIPLSEALLNLCDADELATGNHQQNNSTTDQVAQAQNSTFCETPAAANCSGVQ